MMEDPILQLKNKIFDLTESQRKVADYIIKNPVDVAFLTVDQLARIAGTSTTTIMRLTFNLGYSGYAEFQKKLQDLLRYRADPNTRLEANLKYRDENELWMQCAENQIENIQSTVQSITGEALNQTLEMIYASSHIYCTAIRSAIPVAQSLSYGLSRLRGNCDLILADLGDWTEKVINFTAADLVIAISFPRYGNSVLEFMKAAKGKDAKIIAITDSYSSPLVQYADLILPCSVGSVAFHNSIIAPMFLVDYLISAVAFKDKKNTRKRLEEIDAILLDLNYHYLTTISDKK